MAQEKVLENKVKEFLKSNGCWYVKYWGGGGYTKSGIPDLLVCCEGAFLGVELKAAKGRPSELQLKHLHRIRDAGGTPVLLYPEDLELFKELIRAIKGRKGRTVAAIRRVFEERMKKYE